MGLASRNKSQPETIIETYPVGESIAKGDVVELINGKLFKHTPGLIQVGNFKEVSTGGWSSGSNTCQVNSDATISGWRGGDADLFVGYIIHNGLDVNSIYYTEEVRGHDPINTYQSCKALSYNRAITVIEAGGTDGYAETITFTEDNVMNETPAHHEFDTVEAHQPDCWVFDEETVMVFYGNNTSHYNCIKWLTIASDGTINSETGTIDGTGGTLQFAGDNSTTTSFEHLILWKGGNNFTLLWYDTDLIMQNVTIDASTTTVTKVGSEVTVSDTRYTRSIMLSDSRLLVMYADDTNYYLNAKLYDVSEDTPVLLDSQLLQKHAPSAFTSAYTIDTYGTTVNPSVGYISPHCVMLAWRDSADWLTFGLLQINVDDTINPLIPHSTRQSQDITNTRSTMCNVGNEKMCITYHADGDDVHIRDAALQGKLYRNVIGIANESITTVYDDCDVVVQGYIDGLTNLKPGLYHYATAWGEIDYYCPQNLGTSSPETTFWSPTTLMLGQALNSTSMNVDIRHFECLRRQILVKTNLDHEV